jgi:hypothetical protein
MVYTGGAHVMPDQERTTERETEPSIPTLDDLSWRHFRLGWGLLCVSVAFGLVLDSLHAFKVGFYLDVGAETRRLMWTLAHAHGIGLGLLHLGQGATLRCGLLASASERLRRGSACLVWASALIPLGFFLGGLGTHDADPSIGVFLVPAGGLVLLAGVVSVAVEIFRA